MARTTGEESLVTAALIVVVVVIVAILWYSGSSAQNSCSGAAAQGSCGGAAAACRGERPVSLSRHQSLRSWSETVPQTGRPARLPDKDFSYSTDVSPDDMWLSRPLDTPEAIGAADAVAASAESHGERKGVYQALSRLYSTEDVDPLLFGQGYAYRDNTRPIYDQRSSHGGVWGLQEFSSSGNPGDVGVDVGPEGVQPEAGVDVGPDALAEMEGRSLTYDDGIPENWNLPATPFRWYKPRMRDYYGPEGPTPFVEGIYSPFTPDHQPQLGMDEGPDY